MTSAVPDPTVEALSEVLGQWQIIGVHAEHDPNCNGSEADCAHMCPIPVQHEVTTEEATSAILAARAAAPDALRVRIEALAAEFGECWVTRSEVRCTGFIGGTFNNGGEWVEAMCCLPCRVRALLEDGAQ